MMYGKIPLSLWAGLFTVFPALAADDHCGTAAYPLERLQETFPLGDNGVTEWEVYGKDVGEQGASIVRTLSRN